eukprot:2724829-Amphidinium_carterae.1
MKAQSRRRRELTKLWPKQAKQHGNSSIPGKVHRDNELEKPVLISALELVGNNSGFKVGYTTRDRKGSKEHC